jgi:hypothetical protein
MIGLTMLGQATDLEAAAITADTTPALKVGSGLDEAEILSSLDLARRTIDLMFTAPHPSRPTPMTALWQSTGLPLLEHPKAARVITSHSGETYDPTKRSRSHTPPRLADHVDRIERRDDSWASRSCHCGRLASLASQ